MAQNKTQHSDIDKKIVANIDNGIIVLNQDLKIYHFNKWLELHTGIKEYEILDKKIDDIFNTINSKTLKRKIRTALRIQTPTFYTASTSKYLIPIKINQFHNSSFEYMQQDVSIIPFDEVKGLVALILTDQTIMANTNALLEANIQTINELNAELLKERDTIDKKVLVIKFDKNFLFHEKYQMTKETQTRLTDAMKELKVLEFEESTLSACGDKVCFKSTLVPEYSAKGVHVGFIIFRENITDSKRLEKLDEKDINEAFAKIQTTTSYLSDTIDDFRDYFKPNKKSSEVNILSLFDNSIFFLKEAMHQNNIKYKIDVTQNISINTYKNELLQSIINIIKNSIDAFIFSDVEILNKEISVNVQKLKSHISITITDNAGGIQKDVLQRVFEPYFSTKSKNGTGLGLYMCHTIITSHLQGDIIMTSDDNITRTVIELPYTILKGIK